MTPELYPVEIGLGRTAIFEETTWHLQLPILDGKHYADAQLSDYRQRNEFRWRPPLHLSLEARAIDLSVGTAGFGFWNHPFAPGERGYRLPRALWFFFSGPPNDMPLALDVPGSGFKAAVFNTQPAAFFALLPLAPPGFLLMRVPALYRRLWPVGQAALGVKEHLLSLGLLSTWRRYEIIWRADVVRFFIDDAEVFTTRRVPRGPLGFIAWVDNQYAIVTPQGRFGFGISASTQPQHLLLRQLSLRTLTERL